MDTTKTLTNEEVIKELLAMLQQNAMREQANDVFELCSYVDSLEKKIDAMTQELTNMQNEIKEMKEALFRVSEFIGIKEKLLNGRESVKESLRATDQSIAKISLLGKGLS